MSGLRKTDPARGAAPPGSSPPPSPSNCAAPSDHCHAITGVTAKPSSASPIAGASADARSRRPQRDTASAQPAAVPGTVTACGLPGPSARPVSPDARTNSSVRSAGARPLPFSASTVPRAAS